MLAAALAVARSTLPVGTILAEPQGPDATTPTGIDLEQLAERMVTQSARAKEGEIVLISGRLRDAELLEDIVV